MSNSMNSLYHHGSQIVLCFDAGKKPTLKDTSQADAARYPPTEEITCVYGPEERQVDKVEKKMQKLLTRRQLRKETCGCESDIVVTGSLGDAV